MLFHIVIEAPLLRRLHTFVPYLSLTPASRTFPAFDSDSGIMRTTLLSFQLFQLSMLHRKVPTYSVAPPMSSLLVFREDADVGVKSPAYPTVNHRLLEADVSTNALVLSEDAEADSESGSGSASDSETDADDAQSQSGDGEADDGSVSDSTDELDSSGSEDEDELSAVADVIIAEGAGKVSTSRPVCLRAIILQILISGIPACAKRTGVTASVEST
jgi:hypothetical protein